MRACFKKVIFTLCRLGHLLRCRVQGQKLPEAIVPSSFPPTPNPTPTLPGPLASPPPNHTPSCQAHKQQPPVLERARKRMLTGYLSKGQTGCSLGSAKSGGMRGVARLLGWRASE